MTTLRRIYHDLYVSKLHTLCIYIIINTFNNVVICKMKIEQEQQMKHDDDTTDGKFLRMTAGP